MTALVPGRGASREEIASFVAAVRADPDRREALLPLLREDCAIYADKATSEAERLRGFIMASFAATGLPEAALPVVLEELETGRNPYALAAAARAARAAPALPEGTAALVTRAMRRIRNGDERVDLDAIAPAATGTTTALAELAETLAMIEAAPAPCCARTPPPEPLPPAGTARQLAEIAFEDQDGEAVTYAELFNGRAGLLTFFYTRCANPEKCSLTVSKLARVRDLAEAAGLAGDIVVAGVSYDPGFDLPERLRAYGAARGMRFGATCRLLRTTGPFEPLRDLLALGVGYGEATVNRHRLELFLIGPDGAIAEARTRRLWDEAEVFAALAASAAP